MPFADAHMAPAATETCSLPHGCEDTAGGDVNQVCLSHEGRCPAGETAQRQKRPRRGTGTWPLVAGGAGDSPGGGGGKGLDLVGGSGKWLSSLSLPLTRAFAPGWVAFRPVCACHTHECPTLRRRNTWTLRSACQGCGRPGGSPPHSAWTLLLWVMRAGEGGGWSSLGGRAGRLPEPARPESALTLMDPPWS